jgi:4-hydroxyphenylpyruvate dioxygenase-like putative hemolysin
LHAYCDALRPIEEYKKLESKLNAFDDILSKDLSEIELDTEAGREKWLGLRASHGDPVTGHLEPDAYDASGKDIVEQLLVGMGYRITGKHEGTDVQTVVVSSRDANGVKFLISAHKKLSMDQWSENIANGCEASNLFDASRLKRFADSHRHRQGVGILGFAVDEGNVDLIQERYKQMHPDLLVPGTPYSYGNTRVLEVFAYYRGKDKSSGVDHGTLLRFVEGVDCWCLPGIQRVEATYDTGSYAAFCDHWVSNVFSREGFLNTLNDTLGFAPKVDFNAGVVAAGEAQIESTVTGNTSGLVTVDKTVALHDQSQVYLPINNALSEAGHVPIFLKELGQGVQHVASRVANLPAVIQRANDFRRMTGAGLSFLQIPRSYYGYLTSKRLSQDAGLAQDEAERAFDALRAAGIVDGKDIVDLHVTRERVLRVLPACTNTAAVADHVLRARYNNLYALLGENCSEELYLRIVRNNILVDIQGEDMLLQIFTSKVLQRKTGEEAPFLEFIQRVCSERIDAITRKPLPVRPGCGGFGIRNFLTLFLSIEVSKAIEARAAAERAGDLAKASRSGRMVDAFVEQLDDSNPILTSISNAMTKEGLALDRGDAEEATRWASEKEKGQRELMQVSSKYSALLKKLREEEDAPSAKRSGNECISSEPKRSRS